MSFPSTAEVSNYLHTARKNAAEVEPITKQHGDFSLETAYQIQAAGIQLRKDENEAIIGYKMGLTSKAKMEQMNLHLPIYGVLTDVMQIDNKGTLPLDGRIHPKAEPEMYFITNKELSGKISREEALEACDKVGVAIEILDSRFTGFKYFSLPDVVADNSSSALFTLGKAISTPTDLDLANLKISITDGESTRHEATTAAILGDPLLSLCELITLLGQTGQSLPANSLVLAGAATAAIPLSQGQKIEADIENIGSCSFTVQ